jgi:hypothetical protein
MVVEVSIRLKIRLVRMFTRRRGKWLYIKCKRVRIALFIVVYGILRKDHESLPHYENVEQARYVQNSL